MRASATLALMHAPACRQDGASQTQTCCAQMPEYIAQAVITGMLLLTGKWVSGLAMAALTAWNVRTYLRDEHKVTQQSPSSNVHRPLYVSEVLRRMRHHGGVDGMMLSLRNDVSLKKYTYHDMRVTFSFHSCSAGGRDGGVPADTAGEEHPHRQAHLLPAWLCLLHLPVQPPPLCAIPVFGLPL